MATNTPHAEAEGGSGVGPGNAAHNQSICRLRPCTDLWLARCEALRVEVEHRAVEPGWPMGQQVRRVANGPASETGGWPMD